MQKIVLFVFAFSCLTVISCKKEKQKDRKITGRIVYKASNLPAKNRAFGLEVWTPKISGGSSTYDINKSEFTTDGNGNFEAIKPSKKNSQWHVYSDNHTLQYWTGAAEGEDDMTIEAGTITVDSL